MLYASDRRLRETVVGVLHDEDDERLISRNWQGEVTYMYGYQTSVRSRWATGGGSDMRLGLPVANTSGGLH